MYITRIPNRNSPPAVLLRESYREGGKVKSRTLANLSQLPDSQIELMRRVLKGEALVTAEDAFEIVRSRPHGHVAAVLGTLRRLGLHTWLSKTPTRVRHVVEAMIVARILDPRSKLATARGLESETLFSSLGERLDLHDLEIDELYEAMDWLLTRQPRMEKALAKRHLQDGTLVLYDLTSSYFEGRTCPLAKRGNSRDRKIRHPANRLRSAVQPAWMPHRCGGLRRQHRRSQDRRFASRQTPQALWFEPARDGRRSRHAHRGSAP